MGQSVQSDIDKLVSQLLSLLFSGRKLCINRVAVDTCLVIELVVAMTTRWGVATFLGHGDTWRKGGGLATAPAEFTDCVTNYLLLLSGEEPLGPAGVTTPACRKGRCREREKSRAQHRGGKRRKNVHGHLARAAKKLCPFRDGFISCGPACVAVLTE